MEVAKLLSPSLRLLPEKAWWGTTWRPNLSVVKTEGVRYDQSNWTRVGGRRKHLKWTPLRPQIHLCRERQPKQARMDTKDTRMRTSGNRVPGEVVQGLTLLRSQHTWLASALRLSWTGASATMKCDTCPARKDCPLLRPLPVEAGGQHAVLVEKFRENFHFRQNFLF